MRSYPFSWTKTLAKLGFRRTRGRSKARPDNGRRYACIEQLEARQMLSITVDTLTDVVDASDGVTSLREAIAAAPDFENEVVFHSSLHGGSIELSDQLTINQTITIAGPAASKLTVQGAPGFARVFHILPSAANVKISGLTVTGGKGDIGGGILNQGSLILDHVAVVGNMAAYSGGGIYSEGPLQIANTTIAAAAFRQ